MLTERQKEIQKLRLEGKSQREIAKKLGLSRSTVLSHFGSIDRQAGVPAGFNVYKQTTHVRVEQFIQGLEKRVEGKGGKSSIPKHKDTDLSVWLPAGDPHFGQYSWNAEIGEDYDVEIAARIHETAIQKLLSIRERVDCIYLVSLGDLLHADSRRSETEKSKHLLDTDGRYLRVVDQTRDCLIRSIEFAATRAKKVKVILLSGNHDPNSSGVIARILAAYYRNRKNIEINTEPKKHIYEEYGNNLIGMVHGDTSKLQQLPAIMSHDMREAWGRTRNHYWFTGHIHQQKVFEYPSCVVESFNTLAAKDAYAAEYGYRSRRQMTSIVIHKEHGEIERSMVRPEHFE